jgi:hypothetical protein
MVKLIDYALEAVLGARLLFHLQEICFFPFEKKTATNKCTV